MMANIVVFIIIFSSIIISLTTQLLCFPRRKRLLAIIIAYLCVFAVVSVVTSLYFQQHLLVIRNFSGFLYLPIIIISFRGLLFKKVFINFSQMLISNSLGSLSMVTLSFFAYPKSEYYYTLLLIITLILYSVYFMLMLKYAKLLADKLFAHGNNREWGLYSLSVFIAFIAFSISHLYIENNIVHIFLLFVVFWNYAILCYAIINTHEKSKQKYEANFAKEIISMGGRHYEKLNDLFTALRIMRHDSKYHHNVALNFLRNGKIDKAIEHLSGQQEILSGHDLISFCDNQVINALLVHFSQQCKESDINYSFKVAMPEKIFVSDYDICIIVGNLLQNAFEASKEILENREIFLLMKIHHEQLVLQVRNNYDSSPVKANNFSNTNRGLGLRSVNLVIERYGGKLLIERNANTFIVFLRMELEGAQKSEKKEAAGTLTAINP